MKKAIAVLFAVAALACGARATEVALLSVATEEATLDLARPASLRPTAPQKPLPHSKEFILKLDRLAQLRALEENRLVETENARAREIAVVSDRETQARREETARHLIGRDDFGKAVLKAPDYFSDAIAKGAGMVAVSSDADGFVDAPEGACLVRLLFSVPSFSPAPSPIPNTSAEPVKASLHVALKIESPAGKSLLFTEFDEMRSFRNDDLVGPARQKALETLVRDAVLTAIAKVAETGSAQQGR